MKLLSDLFVNHDGYLSDKWEQYINIYEQELSGLRALGQPVDLLEIGVQNGGSLQLWSKYLPAGSHIVGIDIDETCRSLVLPENVEIMIGNAADPRELYRLLGGRLFDLIIDDGSHRSPDIIATFESLFDRLKDGGSYIAEDLHCSYLPHFGGGFRKSGSAIEWFKALIEAVNFDHIGTPPDLPPAELGRLGRLHRSIARVSFHDSMTVISKHPVPRETPYARIMTGAETPVVDPSAGIWQMAPSEIRNIRLTPAASTHLSATLTGMVANAKEQASALQHQVDVLLHETTALHEQAGGLRQEVANEREKAASYNQNIVDMQREIVRFEDRLAQLQEEHSSTLAELAAHATSGADSTEQLQMKMAAAEEEAALHAMSHRQTAQALHTARQQLEIVQRERDLVLYSTTWRATRPVRTLLEKVGPKTRRDIVNRGRRVYRTLTGQPPVPANVPVPEAGIERAGVEDAPVVENQSYDNWIRLYDTLTDEDRTAIRAHLANFRDPPLISVVMPVYDTPAEFLRVAIQSVRNQIYPNWELCIADDASPSPHVREILTEQAAAEPRIKWMRREVNGHISLATNSALTLATGVFVAFMDHDDILAEQALYEVAAELQRYPDADMLYSDQDLLDESGRRHTPYLKTDWNPDLMYGHNMVSHLGIYRRVLVEKVGGLRTGFEGSQDYDLTLRITAETVPGRIRHIPAVLYHWREVVGGSSMSQTQLDRCVAAARMAIQEHLDATGSPGATVETAPAANWWTRVRWPLPDPLPLVSIVIPTRDRAELLERCTAGLLQRTDYAAMELVIVDNDTREPTAKAILERLSKDRRVSVVPAPGKFNFAALINAGVKAARGSVVVLLNNDIDVIDSGWLRELVSQAIRPDVGAVSAKLLYENTRLQHAGVVLGVGNPSGGPGVADNHGVDAVRHDIGYQGFYALARQVSAVTGACMALRRDVFDAAGGMDADNLPVAYNDIDLCMKIRAMGLAIVWTPFAELFHLESASRGSDLTAERAVGFEREWTYMRQRWARELDRDPFLNPNFGWQANNFHLGFPPVREKPWRSYLPSVAAEDKTEPARYVDWLPARENAGRAFEGEWSSAVPGLPSGSAQLFDDERIKWFEENLGAFQGRRVLELGPLEGGHTYMMTQRGAEVLAIESNRGAWIRCVVAKDVLGMTKATFLLGDFRKYLSAKPDHFDFVLASGVLYHMTDPVRMLEDLAAISDTIGLWTHYFDAESLQQRSGIRDKFDYRPRIATTRHGRKVQIYDQSYREALEWSGFCGGSAPGSVWMAREGIIGVLEDEGFTVTVGIETPDHQHGPAFCVFARKTPGAAAVNPP